MSEDKSEDPPSDLSTATESLKIEEEPKDNGDAGKTDKVKIDILLKATGNAPIMKKKKWAVDAEKPIGWIMEFVKKYLKLEPEERLMTSLLHMQVPRVPVLINHKPIAGSEVIIDTGEKEKARVCEFLFLYINQTFAPSPDQIVKNLYECFGTDGKLVLHYCKSQAWG